ncbi:diguanylate cyclase (GGDEF) domain-containing protein [Cohnella sp. OV330]|uniref:putative bifunctional diguanylate cyclase/phosphodiesterase n=1 Tax=Cohnella sp. OV330 TaxID=1855288 RepID=UPI0008E4FDC6|nr:bifunctional diguanylate cyclase/phosphodiesterase [Cohnella sp. OV330]SFB56607.1 diguanylate cyclase (GGDEF) domain-containing protein [Cohnella sp. OV330]
MLRSGRLPVYLLAGFAAAIGYLYAIYWDNVWMRVLGSNILQIAGGAIGAYWTLRAGLRLTGKRRRFWLLLCAGLILNTLSNFQLLYKQLASSATDYSIFSYMVWLIAYGFFLAALFCKYRHIYGQSARAAYIFNIIVFMVTAVSASIHFVIDPIISIADETPFVTVISVVYPLASLSIFLITLILYYCLLQQGALTKSMLYVIWGMLSQVAGDIGYAYLAEQQEQHSGEFVDVLWVLALLLIGLGGRYAGEEQTNPMQAGEPEVHHKESVFPYASIAVLVILSFLSKHWDFNSLSQGLLLLFLLIMGRQLRMMRVLNKLMGEYRYLAYHDPLTGLKNRIRFQQDLERIIGKAGVRAGLLLIDLDRFKVINDTLGHHAGDLILVQTAERLRRSVGARSPLYRLGGDEFVVILTDAENSWCAAAADRILGEFREPFRCEGIEIIVTPSIGISIYPDNGCTSNDLLKYADAAMYLAKESGKNSFRFYDTELHAIMARKMKLEHELRRAIERRQFKLHYQPKFELRTKRIIGMEALLRWEHPELGIVSPAEFIPVAEESGQIVAIGDWVLERACEQNKSWQDKGYPPLCISVNVSVRQFQHREFLMSVRSVLQRTGLPAAYLELEITESIMQNVKEGTEVLRALRRMGISISIDDFGTGYSSLFIIPKLPVDTIKIDKSFIDDIDDRVQLSMLKTIIDLGLSLNLGVVAEGIESEHQRQVLVAHGCPVGQGYLYSRPVSPEAFEEMLSAAGESGTNTEILSG